MRRLHTHKQDAATIFNRSVVLRFKAALIAELVLRPDTLEVHAVEKLKTVENTSLLVAVEHYKHA